jgi:trimethylamine--corrinoid protein Co-methyltransferase
MIDLEVNAALWNYSRGIQVDDEHIALGLIKEQGIGGNFLGTNHTLAHFREHWMPQLMDRTAWDESEQGSRKEEEIIERAIDKWRTALKNHVPRTNLDGAQIRAIDKVVRQARLEFSD